jgi:hypothetical protein
MKGNIKTSAKDSLGGHEFKQHTPWIDEECLGFLYQRKQTKMQVGTVSKSEQYK